ncbi:MAG TPA: DUF3397 family protein [Pseudogracilibacillus sp.]|nr:DUF3397 family protein [Pseudogracilibacillus sp.]
MDTQWLDNNLLIILLLPFIWTLLIYFIVRFFKTHRWRKVHIIVQWSALAYVFGVVLIVDELYNVFILSYVLIVFILFLALQIVMQWRNDTSISLMTAIVLLLRIVFLLFIIAYIVLIVIYGIRIFA